ncbi:hypothetical protein [Ramlibacter albus]|nr:hypothetical protein [Ramlibacter albus]
MVTIALWNESDVPVRFSLEPYAESFEMPAHAQVKVHAECQEMGGVPEFTVGYAGSLLTVYAPGAPTHLHDVYVTLNGQKLDPV